MAVRSTAELSDLPLQIRRALSEESGQGELTLQVRNTSFTVEGRGAKGLTFSHPREIVVRKSGYVSDRTLMVRADRAAVDIPREMVKLLQDPNQQVRISISATILRDD